MTWRRPARLGPEAAELLDERAGSAAEEAEAYRLLEQVNLRLGGYGATFRALAGLFDSWPEDAPLDFVDIAGGDGAFADKLVRWARDRGRPAHALVVDLNPVALDVARARPAVRVVRADALRLPLADGSADCVHCAAFFHHLGVDQARALLVEMCRVSRGVVVVNDLVRSWVATGAIWALARLLTDNRLVQYDGPLSVRKSFVPDELRSLAHAVGTTAAGDFRWRLRRQFPYRMALVGARAAPAEHRAP